VAVACPLITIGIVRTDRHVTEATPVQSSLNPSEQGTIEIAEEFAAGLTGLDGFDYAWLLTWLHGPDDNREQPPPLIHVPFLLRPQRRRMGIFATRGPRRVNPIGLSLVRIIEVSGRTVRFAGVDLVDGTPVVDLKPYVTHFDRVDGEVRSGWFDDVPLPAAVTPAQLGRPETDPADPSV
jgi:tRNA-Thr(GGU) m(6)t(6)A37 methyltransferase TsaA